MRYSIVLITFVVGVFFNQAQAGDFGAGLVLGHPSGLAVNYWFDQEHSFDGAFGGGVAGADFVFHTTHLWHFLDRFKVKGYSFGYYLGLGAKFESGNFKDNQDEFRMGPRGSIGLRLPFKEIPLDTFAELNNAITFGKSTGYTCWSWVSLLFLVTLF